MTKNKAVAVLLPALTSIPLLAFPAQPVSSPPNPIQILNAALDPPSSPYQGLVTLIERNGAQAHAEKARVFYAPPDHYRWEFLSPHGILLRIMVSDGIHEQVYLPKQRRMLTGSAAKSAAKILAPDRERELLLNNYQVSLLGPGQVAGRPTWVLELVPKLSGKPHAKLWVDAETNLILESKKFRPKGAYAGMVRFIQLRWNVENREGLFELDPDSQTKIMEHGLDPDFLSLDELNQATGKSLSLPMDLPGGFVFESADFFEIRGKTVCHLRYTDGMTTLSLFQTNHAVRMSNADARSRLLSTEDPRLLRSLSSGNILRWKDKGKYYTLIADLSQNLLKDILSQLKNYLERR